MLDWTQWNAAPGLIDGLAVLAWLYAMLAGPLRGRLAPPGTPWPTALSVRFYASLVVTYLAAGSPWARLGDHYLFSLHILLQMLVVYAASGLMLAGLPPWMIDRTLGARGWRVVWRVLSRPVITGAVFVLCFSAWYVPRIFGRVLTHPYGPAVEALLFLGAGLMYWWPLLSPSAVFPSLGYGGRIIYLTALEVGLTGIFSYILMAEHPMYPTYEAAPRALSWLSALDDQILGGVLLSAISSFVLVVVLGLNFRRWATTDKEKSKPARR